MFLIQRNEEITIGKPERTHKLSVKRFGHFTRDDAHAACDDLLGAYPEDAARIEQFRARLLAML